MKACRMVQKAMALAAMGLAALGTPLTASAVTRTWTGTANWSTAANWGGTLPADGDDVVVASGAVTLTAATPALTSVTVNSGAKITFDVWSTVMTAGVVTVNGTIDHADNTDTTAGDGWTPNARVNIVCGSLVVPTGGKIDVTSKGYKGGINPSVGGIIPGCGPGGGGNGGNGHGIGGSHGGFGGEWLASSSGPTNDTYSAPSNPGSGAGPGGDRNVVGGAGGGVVTINALGSVTVNGSILANGGNGGGNWGGGGSGGSVYITCQTFSGTGVVRAAGGNNSNVGSGGGGGCIAIVYNPAAQAAISLPSAQITTLGGNNNASVATVGGVGTLYFPDNQFLTRVTASDVVRLGGQWLDPSFTEWNLDTLTMNNAWLRFRPVGFKINVTNNLSITGADNRIYRLELTNGVVACGGDMTVNKATLMLYTANTTGPSVSCDGNFKLTNQALMFLHCGTNSAAAPDTTALVDVGGTMTVDTTSWVYPVAINAFAPAAPRFDVGNLFVGTGSGFDASLQGWSGATNKLLSGFGPGKGYGQSGGAGHGGKGGGPNGGADYGSASDPVTLGSGGGAGDNNHNLDARGGGALRINAAGKVAINGSLLANGGNGKSNHGGGGSGGSVNILCDTFWGTNGVIGANGGTGANTVGGGGAGGRIAIRYNAAAQSAVPVPAVTVSANGGLGGSTVTYTRRGDLGTIYFPDTRMLVSPAGFLLHSGVPVVPGIATWSLDNLVVSNAYFKLPDNTTLNVANALVISGTHPELHQLAGSNVVINCGTLNLDKSAGLAIFGGIVADSATPGAQVNVTGDMTIGPNAWVYPSSHPTNGGSVRFTMDNLTVNATGGFNALGRGFSGGANGSNGFGPGRGYSSSSKTDRGGGGGYGAQGMTFDLAIGGYPYGSASMPTQPGSGGGAQKNSLSSVGGYGGGLVWVEAAGDILMNGTINANGGEATGNSGAGSGGGVYLRCATFTGTGSITANGGSWYVGGGGGRIAVVYTDLTAQALLSPAVRFNATSTLSQGTRGFDQGSLYFPDTTFFPYPTIFGSYNIAIPTMVPTWNGSSLVVTNGEVHFPGGCSLNLSGDLAIGKGGIVIFTNNPEIACANLSVTNGGIAHFYAEATNGVAPGYGAKVQVAGTLRVGAGSTANVYSERYTGGSVFFDAGALQVDAGGLINADGRGYVGGTGRGVNGLGPGGGIGDWSSDRGGGAGYGGKGASTTANEGKAKGGAVYGTAELPLLPGSGGGGKSSATAAFGGGLVWMRVRGNSHVDGIVSANGAAATGWPLGDGSGGGIFLDCGSLSGGGAIRANGGQIADTSGAHGGGGRIAVWQGVPDFYRAKYLAGRFGGASITNLPPATFTGSATAACGTVGYTGEKAAPGTVVFLTAPPLASVIVVR